MNQNLATFFLAATFLSIFGVLIQYFISLSKNKQTQEEIDYQEFLKTITPLEKLNPKNVKSYEDRPWRPFRWPYHQTMSIFKLDLNHWLDMDKWYIRYIEEKEKILIDYGKKCYDWLPESEVACNELLDTIVHHLSTRYPSLFRFDSEKNVICNLITEETIDLSSEARQQEHSLIKASKLAKEDFYVIHQRPDGKHYMIAGAVPFPGGEFNVGNLLGRELDSIHEDVPYYEEKLKRSMEKYFGKMRPEMPIERASWNITWDHELFYSKIYLAKHNGPEVMKNIPFEKFNIRVERQALRKLPKSKAIIFSNHPIFYSIDELKDEPMVPSLIKKILQEGPDKIIKYKKFDLVEPYLIPYLDKLIQRQVELGLIQENDPIKTLPTYPFATWINEDRLNRDNGWSR